jgi:hypothetical protein
VDRDEMLVRATEDLDIFIRATAENVARLKRAFRDAYAAETIDVEGVGVRVATPRALFELKRGTVRPQDHQDAEALRRHFGLEDGT